MCFHCVLNKLLEPFSLHHGYTKGTHYLAHLKIKMATINGTVNSLIRPVARKGDGPIAHEAKPNGLLTRGP